MPRSAAKFLGPLAGLLLAFHGYFAVRGLYRSPGEVSAFGRGEVGNDLLFVLVASVTGRILLSWLPPGPQGSHTPRALPVTWAVSYLLGVAVLHIEGAAMGFLPDFGQVGGLMLFAAPWILLAVLRLMTLPAAMVPRHEPRRERAGPATLALYAIAAVWVVTFLSLNLTSPIQSLGSFAFMFLVAHGLGQARRAPAGIAVFVLLGFFTVGVGNPPLAPVYFGTGAAFLIGWLRRADRRACWLSAIAFAACAVTDAPTLVGAGLLTLVLASWRGQRKYAATAAGVSALLIGLPGFFGVRADAWFQGAYLWLPSNADISELFQRAFSPSQWGVAWFLFAATILAGVVARIRSREADREQLGLLLLFVFGCLAQFPLVWNWSNLTLLQSMFPVALLLAGLVWIPEEEPD
ncbi:MAG: hypothetical protein JRG76_18765 [Deltaproteobacteria bacterium]|nr:hypothetical protein [Deltaproteobacteria bacterium]